MGESHGALRLLASGKTRGGFTPVLRRTSPQGKSSPLLLTIPVSGKNTICKTQVF